MKKLILPNGKPLYYLDKISATDVYREIYVDHEYLQGGITFKPNQIVFDVGANIGLFSSFVAEQCPTSQIFAFEPVPQIFETLKANIGLLSSIIDSSFIHLYPFGLSDKSEQIEFNYYPKVSADSTAVPYNQVNKIDHYIRNWKVLVKQIPIARILPSRIRPKVIKMFLDRMYKPIKVQCELKTLSEIIAMTKVPRIDLLKIDAENYEGHVIKGIKDEDWPKIQQIAIEVHQHIEGGEHLLEEINTLFQRKGFKTTIGNEYFAPGSGVFMLYAIR